MSLPIVSISTSIRYGNYKKYYQLTQTHIKLLTENFFKIQEYITLPKELFVHFRPIRDAYGRAFVVRDPKTVYGKNYIVEIDARENRDVFTDTILHELVHIEQFYQRRLSNSSQDGCFKWKGKHMSFIKPIKEEYDRLPWEEEAIKRAKSLVNLVF